MLLLVAGGLTYFLYTLISDVGDNEIEQIDEAWESHISPRIGALLIGAVVLLTAVIAVLPDEDLGLRVLKIFWRIGLSAFGGGIVVMPMLIKYVYFSSYAQTRTLTEQILTFATLPPCDLLAVWFISVNSWNLDYCQHRCSWLGSVCSGARQEQCSTWHPSSERQWFPRGALCTERWVCSDRFITSDCITTVLGTHSLGKDCGNSVAGDKCCCGRVDHGWRLDVDEEVFGWPHFFCTNLLSWHHAASVVIGLSVVLVILSHGVLGVIFV